MFYFDPCFPGSSGYQDNVVCLSPRLAQSLGNMGQVCVCVRVTSTIHLIDPRTLQSECFYSLADWMSSLFPVINKGCLDFLIVYRLVFAHMQRWRVSMFKLLRSKNKDQKHLSSWLRKLSRILRLIFVCSTHVQPSHGRFGLFPLTAQHDTGS